MILLTALATSVFTQQPEQQELSNIYIHSSQIVFLNNAIFANFQEELIPVRAIYADAYGLIASIDWSRVRWICPRCGYNNDGDATTCQKALRTGGTCGERRPSPRQ